MSSPFFSVVIPTYNRSSLVERAIKSVLSQSFVDFEIIVVDDGSTDDTSSRVNSFHDPRIKYVQNRRSKGACGARNTGVAAASAEWIAFLDDDDEWLSDKLRYQFDLIKVSDKSIGLVSTDYAVYKGPGEKLRIVKNQSSGWVQAEDLMEHRIGCLSSTCVRKQILQKIGGFDETFPACQDRDLWVRVAQVSQFATVNRPLVLMYQEERFRISRSFRKKLEGLLLFRDKHESLVAGNIRLRHRQESKILIYALLESERTVARNCLPWFLIGILADFPYCFYTYSKTLLFLYKFRNVASRRKRG